MPLWQLTDVDLFPVKPGCARSALNLNPQPPPTIDMSNRCREFELLVGSDCSQIERRLVSQSVEVTSEHQPGVVNSAGRRFAFNVEVVGQRDAVIKKVHLVRHQLVDVSLAPVPLTGRHSRAPRCGCVETSGIHIKRFVWLSESVGNGPIFNDR